MKEGWRNELEHASRGLVWFCGVFALGYLFLPSFKQLAWLLMPISMKGYIFFEMFWSIICYSFSCIFVYKF